MEYIIIADKSKWTKVMRKALPYNEYADCTCELEITFSYENKKRIYRNKIINIPLFLTELDNFLNKINSGGHEYWYLGFAPFAHGLLRDGSLLISSRMGKAFSDGVYDITQQDDLAHLRAQVTKDISKFGRVITNTGQGGRIVSDF